MPNDLGLVYEFGTTTDQGVILTKNDISEAEREAKDLILRDKVRTILGTYSSACAAAMKPVHLLTPTVRSGHCRGHCPRRRPLNQSVAHCSIPAGDSATDCRQRGHNT